MGAIRHSNSSSISKCALCSASHSYNVLLCNAGCPDVSDIAELVLPSSHKIDLEHLLRNLPKYKPLISVPAWEAWEIFVSKTAELDLVTQNPGPWALPIILSAAIVSHSSISQLEPLGAEITKIASKESACPAKVCYIKIRLTDFYCCFYRLQ